MVPRPWRVTGHADEIAHPQRRGREQVGLQGQPVAIATGDLQHRLHAPLQQETRHRLRCHAHARAVRVGEIERIHHATELFGVGQQGSQRRPLRWVEIGSDEKFPRR